jgi:peptidoglycan hydrolase-like protein with peptidoglycan-binding domain
MEARDFTAGMRLARRSGMSPLLHSLAAVLLAAPLSAAAAGAFTAIHPEEAYPDPTERPSADPYSGFISRVQQKLRELGFAAGPVNGDFGAKTQAALTQFQLSRTLPASGQLDDHTLAELGVSRDEPPASESAAGGTAEVKPGG